MWVRNRKCIPGAETPIGSVHGNIDRSSRSGAEQRKPVVAWNPMGCAGSGPQRSCASAVELRIRLPRQCGTGEPLHPARPAQGGENCGREADHSTTAQRRGSVDQNNPRRGGRMGCESAQDSGGQLYPSGSARGRNAVLVPRRGFSSVGRLGTAVEVAA